MKFMKLGSRPDTFYTSESIRSISSEVPTDIKIQVQDILYHLHKFPLLSKCGLLQPPCTKDSTINLSDIPGGADAFDLCAKFCYGIAITVSPANFVSLRCAAEHLVMTDAVDRGNLAGKLQSFFNSCILHRWKDTILTLQTTSQFPSLCEELNITDPCIKTLAKTVLSHPSKQFWVHDLAELSIEHYWRILAVIKPAGVFSGEILGEAIKVYACRWIPNVGDLLQKVNLKHKMILENLVTLLPVEKNSVSCSFLLKLLKLANILNASDASKLDLARRIGLRLEEANVQELLIPCFGDGDEIVYDVDVVIAIVEEFVLQGRSPMRSRSAERVDFEGSRSTSASHGSMLRVAKLIDLYLVEIARNEIVTVEKMIELVEAVPDFARMDHDDLYRVVDTYLRGHPQLEKKERKKLCQILNCKKLSMEACMHAAQNEMLPLRLVVQVLFFEQARAAAAGNHATELPCNIKALLTKAADFDEKKVTTLKMKLEEDENDVEEKIMVRDGLIRSNSSRFRSLCSIPSRPRKMMSKFWSMSRSVSGRH